MATNGDSFGTTTGTLPMNTGGAGLGGTGAVDQAKNTAQDLAGQAKAKLADVQGQAQAAVGDIREQAMKYKDQALDQARHAAEDGKTKAADTIHGVAGDLREAATSLGRNQTIAPVGKYANQAADALEQFAGDLRDKNVDQLVTEVSGFVRRNPAVAIGIAVAAGFALTQLLRGGNSMSSGGSMSSGNFDRYDA